MSAPMSVTTFERSPSLGPLFARAILTAPRRRPTSTLLRSRLRLIDETVDPTRLARYQQVCGFAVSQVLPPTYLHVLAFPLSVARMTQSDFPFSLLGLVHVQNVIEQRRPVTVDELISLDVWADNRRPHSAGEQVDLISEARVGGELVWRETSTYLRRVKSASAARSTQPKPAIPDVPATSTVQYRVPRDIGRRYAAIAGDRNPIHLHDLTARAFGYRKAIAHGMWLKARTLAALQGRLAPSYAVDVAFKTPVFLPATVTLAAVRSSDEQWSLDVRDVRTGKPHLTGHIQAAQTVADSDQRR
jgi:acyl dehydratase